MLIADDLELVGRIEHAAAEDAAAVARVLARHSPQVGVQRWAGGRLVALGAGGYVNRAIGAGLNARVAQEEIAEAETFFHARHLPLEIELAPHAQPNIADALQGRATVVRWFRSVVARRLTDADVHLGDEAISAEIVEDATLARWQAIHREATGVTGDAAEISDAYAAAAHAVEGATDLLATVGGQFVGAASMIMRDGRALFGGAATLPAYRNQGVQAALVRIRLARAARQGCDLAVASVEPGSASARNLQRQGFHVLYTSACIAVSG